MTFDAKAPPMLSGTDQDRLARWRRHLAARGVTIPTAEDFLAFGRLSTLERLRPVLAMSAPDEVGPLRLAIRQLKREKSEKARRAGPARPRGPRPTLTVGLEALPADWLARLEDLRAESASRPAASRRFSRRPLGPSRQKHLEHVLRVIAKERIEAAAPVVLDDASLRGWFAAARERGRALAGLSAELELLARFVEPLDAPLARRIRTERVALMPLLRRKRKKKEDKLLATGLTLGRAWAMAEDLLTQSRAAPRGSRRAMTLALHATAIALAVVAPLRVGDLHRLQVGRSLIRDAAGWRIEIVTSKTGASYERSLWSEIDPFLERLMTLDAPGGDFLLGYDHRNGTWLFSVDAGATPLSADWISDVWYRHLGCGAHIVRSLWHDIGLTSEADMTHVALYLCGQSSGQTALHYQTERAHIDLRRRGQGLLRRARAEEQNGAIDR